MVENFREVEIMSWKEELLTWKIMGHALAIASR